MNGREKKKSFRSIRSTSGEFVHRGFFLKTVGRSPNQVETTYWWRGGLACLRRPNMYSERRSPGNGDRYGPPPAIARLEEPPGRGRCGCCGFRNVTDGGPGAASRRGRREERAPPPLDAGPGQWRCSASRSRALRPLRIRLDGGRTTRRPPSSSYRPDGQMCNVKFFNLHSSSLRPATNSRTVGATSPVKWRAPKRRGPACPDDGEKNKTTCASRTITTALPPPPDRRRCPLKDYVICEPFRVVKSTEASGNRVKSLEYTVKCSLSVLIARLMILKFNYYRTLSVINVNWRISFIIKLCFYPLTFILFLFFMRLICQPIIVYC